jgi:hypothetical protein
MFAYLLVPDDPARTRDRDMIVVDLKTLDLKAHITGPEGVSDEAAILEFHWINDSSLLIAVTEDLAQDAVSRWIYNLIGDCESNG